jgi:hypothetical protein
MCSAAFRVKLEAASYRWELPLPEFVRVFLSTVANEFGDYRDRLRSKLTRHNVEVKIQEDFKDLGGVTLDKLDFYIKACDAVVHLVGDMTGGGCAGTVDKSYP